MIHRVSYMQIPIPAGATASAITRISAEMKVLGFYTDAAWVTGAVSFKGSPAEIVDPTGNVAAAPATVLPMYDDGANLIQATGVVASRYISITQLPVMAANWWQFVSSVAQTAGSTLTVALEMA
jgi:hypothetical protein